MSMFELMAAPFVECLILVGIHTYLGVHVLRRRVIFVDLALAQIAALGTTVGFFFGILPETSAALVFSMAFTFIGAGIFAITRIRGERVPQEAIIGLVYAITAATAVLVVEKTQGAEHLKDILVGSLLWVTWSDVATAAIAYAFIGVIHYVLRDKFLLISENPEKAYESGLNVRAWDFLFYVTFGFVITFSTRVAGVLLVFVFLVAPAIMAFLITDKLKPQLLIGWAMGTAVTVFGLFASYHHDLPSGPTVVASYGVALALGSLIVFFVRARDKARAVRRLLFGTGTAAVVCVLLYAGATGLAATDLALSDAVEHVEADMARAAAAEAPQGVGDQRERVAALSVATHGCVAPGQLRRYAAVADPDERLALVEQEMAHGRRRGMKLLLTLLADAETPVFFRSEGVTILEEVAGTDFGYDPEGDESTNAEALDRMCKCLQDTGRPLAP